MPPMSQEEEMRSLEKWSNRLYDTLIEIKDYIGQHRKDCDLDHILKIIDDHT